MEIETPFSNLCLLYPLKSRFLFLKLGNRIYNVYEAECCAQTMFHLLDRKEKDSEVRVHGNGHID